MPVDSLGVELGNGAVKTEQPGGSGASAPCATKKEKNSQIFTLATISSPRRLDSLAKCRRRSCGLWRMSYGSLADAVSRKSGKVRNKRAERLHFPQIWPRL